MPYFSNREIQTAPPGYEPARVDDDGRTVGPRCCGEPMQDDGDCGEGCCDDYRCNWCGHTVRIEWPD